jgi:predicted dehydrogenase
VRVAIVGTGFWATNAHLPALRALKGVHVDACVGLTLQMAQEFANEREIPSAYGSVQDLFDSADRPDLLVIASPDSSHVSATTLALEAGIPVFCEKPLANRASEAQQVAALADRVRVPATVGYSFRYSPAVQALYRDMQAGSLGEPWLLELFEYNAQFHPALGKPMNWKGDPDHAAAGALFEYGSHVVDIATWIAGPVQAVSTSLTRVLPGARLDDIATLQMRLRPPGIGILVAGWVLSGTMPGIRIRVHAAEGLAEVELGETIPGGQAYRRYALDGSIKSEAQLEELGNRYSAYAQRHHADFIARVNGELSAYPGTLPDLSDGAEVQSVLEAALRGTREWATVVRVTAVS